MAGGSQACPSPACSLGAASGAARPAARRAPSARPPPRRRPPRPPRPRPRRRCRRGAAAQRLRRLRVDADHPLRQVVRHDPRRDLGAQGDASSTGRRCRCLTLLVAKLGCAGARRFEHRGAFPEAGAMHATARSFGAHPLCRGGLQKLPPGSPASFIIAPGRAWAQPRAPRASVKQRLKSERSARSYRWDARSRSESARRAALPMEGEKASHAACLRASSDAGGRTWSKPGASRMGGKQRLKSERIVRRCRWGA